MTYLTGEVTVVHDWTEIDFANYVYSRVYFTRTFGTVVINGATLVKKFGTSFDIVVDPHTTIIDDPFTILLGNPRSTLNSNIKGGVDEYVSKYSMLFDTTGVGGEYMDSLTSGGAANPLNLTTSATISAWLRPINTTGSDQWIVDRGAGTTTSGYALMRDPFGGDEFWSLRIGFDIAGTETIRSTTICNTSRWDHVVGTWDTSTLTMSLYVNGVKENEFINPNAGDFIKSNTTRLLFGARTPGPTSEYEGFINNVSIWDISFNQSQITELFNDGAPGDLNQHSARASGVSWWPCGENTTWDGTAWTASDVWGGFDTVSVNMDWDNRKIAAPQLNIDA